MSPGPPRLRVDPADEPRLAARARELAVEEAAGDAAEALEVVAFSIAGRPCAVVTTAVVRAVARLGHTTEVPQAGGAARAVAWVDEQPVAVTDLVELAGLPRRSPAALAQAPALLLSTPAGLAALAVEGPLVLAEEPVAQRAGAALAGLPGLGVAGRLAGGATLLSADWLQARAGGAGAP